MVRKKKMAVDKQKRAKSTLPSIRSFFPTVTPARWQTPSIQSPIEPVVTPSHPSSDDFNTSQAFLAYLNLGDVDMADIPDHAVKPNQDKAHDERVATNLSVRKADEMSMPPATPPLDTVGHSDTSAEPIADYPNLEMADALFMQEPDSVRLSPPVLPNKKRPLPESVSPPLAQKVSRESETHQSARLYSVNTLLAIRSEASRSFDSNTSTALSSTSTNATTPSTSFPTDISCTSVQSPAASFGVAPIPFAGLLDDQVKRLALDPPGRGANNGSADGMGSEKTSPGKTVDPFSPRPSSLDHAAPRTRGIDEYLANLLLTGPFGNCLQALLSLNCNC